MSAASDGLVDSGHPARPDDLRSFAALGLQARPGWWECADDAEAA